ncbi:SDR family NAD(P)-dependent oxidoreductase [Pseudovibrio sp. Tun.PSC04-5.I4]|uniref:SDR family NAD(P)-dependent oxidoreductase n=1 Tax=Pseudovibrio sp. Tun.PSC04-5.I4 TaxID=1798213 RepID=UPI000889EFA7|nr:SDR family NAD(P)-dependent oxidoreductase [Pseudovibrio sp. Tun.PSC04-5.I4]SDR44862.1 Short-chain dehydrogenase [Pseudovibrio sp. Tun.PSC04-5.I4]
MYTYSPTAILITGASSGLGKALALEYGRVGVVLWLTGRNEARLLKTVRAAEQQGATVFWKILDISDQEQVRDWIDEIEEQTPLDLVISNAGITGSHSIGDEIETANTAHAQVSTNLGGTINLVTAIAPYMQKRRSGRIALISSLAGMQPISDGPAYGASKAGIIAYGEAMRDHLHEWDVFVSVICPGYIRTPMADQFKSWRPFEYSAEQAANAIRKSVARKKAFFPFPWPLVLGIRIGKFLPWKLRRLANQRFNYER